MNLLSVLATAVLLFLCLGCDGDGDGTTATTTTEATAEETDTGEALKGPLTLDTGSARIAPGDASVVSSFSVFETGMIEGTAEWGIGPSKLCLYLSHDSGATASQYNAESPATVMMAAAQDLLDISNGWVLRIYNPDSELDASVGFSVTFMPD